VSGKVEGYRLKVEKLKVKGYRFWVIPLSTKHKKTCLAVEK
jgi:hypothetical protein